MEIRLDELIVEGEKVCTIHAENLRRKSSQGIFDGTGKALSESNEWFSDIKIFSQRKVKDHPLYDSLESTLFHEKNRMSDVRKILGILKSLKKDIYFMKGEVELEKNPIKNLLSEDVTKCENLLEVTDTNKQKPIVFISHKSDDFEYGEVIRNLLIQIGLKNSDIVFTSNPSNKIPFGSDIFEYLKKKIHSETFVLYLLSDAYFSSSACLNEMGAAWIIQADSNALFTSDFQHNHLGYLGSCVEKSKMGATLNGDRHCRNSLIDLVNKIKATFNLEVSNEDATNFADEACEKFIKMNKGD